MSIPGLPSAPPFPLSPLSSFSAFFLIWKARPFNKAARNLKLRLDFQVLKPAARVAIQISPSGVCCCDEMSGAGQFIEKFT